MNWSIISYILSLLLWAAALPLKTYSAGWSKGGNWQGLLNFLLGFLGLFTGTFVWLANPLLLAAAITYFKVDNKMVSFVLALAGLMTALSFLLQKKIIIDEAGHYGEITAYHAGYWLWVLSMLFMTLACYIKMESR